MIYELIAPPQPYKAIIFDCDGTLVDTMPAHAKAWSAAYGARGISISEQPFIDMGGLPNRAIIEKLNTDQGHSVDVLAMEEEKEHRYSLMVNDVKEITEVADIARALHGKVPIAVASSGMGRIVRQTLTVTNLISLFDVIVTADDVLHGKPAPDLFLLAAERLGVAPEDCVVYEDGNAGLEAAARAGMRAVDVRVLWREPELV